ncbi:hypothetical protein ERJ75_001142600 [Trypanosoma vivax]|nr:hypothetical protein ERJ75_001142600 [Trypanosoma vivax]
MTTRWRRETSTKLADADMALEPANRLRRGSQQHAAGQNTERVAQQPMQKRNSESSHSRSRSERTHATRVRASCAPVLWRKHSPVASKKETTHGSKGTVDIGQQRMAQNHNENTAPTEQL